MQGNETPNEERQEIIEELSALLFVIQEIGHRLALETHGEAYDLVRELNEHVHQAWAKMEQIQKT